MPYDPGHPWYYLKRGDHRPPLPADQIEACDWVSLHGGKPDKPPKNLSAAVERAEASLASELARYADLVTRGIKAVSKYDIDICCRGDAEMAWAQAVGLTHNHIVYLRGHLAWLRSLLPQPANANLAVHAPTDGWSSL